MHVLIVEDCPRLATDWATTLRRAGCTVHVTATQADAVDVLSRQRIKVVMLDLALDDGSPLAIADFAGFRQPWAKVVFLTRTSVFSDGSIFAHCQNACAFLRTATSVDDLAAIVEHYGRAA